MCKLIINFELRILSNRIPHEYNKQTWTSMKTLKQLISNDISNSRKFRWRDWI